VPGLRWVRAIGPDHIVVIANDAKYSYAAKDGTLFITAVRSPVFSHHEPIKLREDAYLRYMDQGPRTFTIRVCGDSEVTRRQAHVMSDNLTKPPLVTTHVTRHGTCPHAGTWLGIDADEHTVVSTIKTAEDTDDLIVRVLELDGVTGGVTYQAMPASIGPYQIATFRLRDERLIPSDGLES
jgi:alpha-mannosidase